jgi:hypothetical protein
MICGWCAFATSWEIANVWVPVWTWITTTWTTCTRSPCNWWCLCCNKWLCWTFLIVLAVVAMVLFFVLLIVTIVVCFLCLVLCAVFCALPSIFGLGSRCMSGCMGEFAVSLSPGGGDGSGSGPASSSSRLTNDPGAGPGTIASKTLTTLQSTQVDEPTPDGWSRSCGCTEGMIGVVGALIVFGLLARTDMLFDYGRTSVFGLTSMGLAFVCTGATAGKLIGLLHHRRKGHALRSPLSSVTNLRRFS